MPPDARDNQANPGAAGGADGGLRVARLATVAPASCAPASVPDVAAHAGAIFHVSVHRQPGRRRRAARRAAHAPRIPRAVRHRHFRTATSSPASAPTRIDRSSCRGGPSIPLHLRGGALVPDPRSVGDALAHRHPGGRYGARAEALAGVPLDDNRCARATWEPARWTEAIAGPQGSDGPARRGAWRPRLLLPERVHRVAGAARPGATRGDLGGRGRRRGPARRRRRAAGARWTARRAPRARRLLPRARRHLRHPGRRSERPRRVRPREGQRALTDIDPEIRDQLWHRAVWSSAGRPG